LSVVKVVDKLALRLQQAQRAGTGDGFGAPRYLEFAKDLLIVAFDRTHGQDQPLAHLLVRKSLRNEA
jgi:hypothetical protein